MLSIAPTLRYSTVIIFIASVNVFGQSADVGGSWWVAGPAVAVLLLGAVAGYIFRRSRGTKKVEADSSTENQIQRRQKSAASGHVPPSTRKVSTAKGPINSGKGIHHLPISSLKVVGSPRMYEPLADSDDEALLAAIEEIGEEGDPDPEVRMLALRVLGSFKTCNSVEAIAQAALYDLSSNIRAKAVSLLAEFDDPSVFETIILACADPSREVRAAGAKAMSKVTFDRADEWARIALAADVYMRNQIAKAAVEAGIAERAFERLTHRDENAVYEAFALVNLIIRSGETDVIFEAVRERRDICVRLALLHCIEAANVAETIPHLSALISTEQNTEVADKARSALLNITGTPVGA